MPYSVKSNKKFRHQVYKPLPEDRELLANLKFVEGGRPAAFMALVPLVLAQPKRPAPPKPKRDPIRLAIPRELDEALTDAAERTHRTKLDCLLDAARAFRQQNPPK